MKSVGWSALIAIALVSWMSVQDAPPQRPTVESVLSLAETAYSSIDAFAATGWVDSSIVEDDGSERPYLFERREFDVFFVRPDTLMLMLVHAGSKEFSPWSCMLNSQGGQATYTSSADPATIESTTLEGGIGAFAALGSHGPSLIAGLLLPTAVSRFRIRDLVEPALTGEESIKDAVCWKVTSKFPGLPHAVTLWIARSSGQVCQATLDHPEGVAWRRSTIRFETIRARTAGSLTMQPVIGGPAR